MIGIGAATHSYDEVRTGIENLRTFEGESWHISDKTAAYALAMVNILEHIGCPVPRIFNTGDDALVLTWEINGKPKAYMTLTDEECALPMIYKP